jgi:hypothetical protein
VDNEIPVYAATARPTDQPVFSVTVGAADKLVSSKMARWFRYKFKTPALQLFHLLREMQNRSGALTAEEIEANAGAHASNGMIAQARAKVGAYPLVGVDPKFGTPTKAPRALTLRSGGIDRPM